jgi:3-hydroxybutyryl-CoA dehydrogenase
MPIAARATRYLTDTMEDTNATFDCREGADPADAVAVIGASPMGIGIAAAFARAGRLVRVYDDAPGRGAHAQALVAQELAAYGFDASASARVSTSHSLENAVSDTEFVFESASEIPEVKREVITRSRAAMRPDAVLGTNTSAVPVTELVRDVADSSLIIGAHWWKPSLLVPLVELVQTPTASAEAIARVHTLLSDIQMRPVHVKRDVVGAIGNRLFHAMLREAFALVADGVCDAKTLDEVVTTSFGRRLAVAGPMETVDWWGIDVVQEIHGQITPHLTPGSGPSAHVLDLIARGDVGMASGQGFRSWGHDAGDRLRELLTQTLSQQNQPHTKEAS